MPGLFDESEERKRFRERLKTEIEKAAKELRSEGHFLPTPLVERFKLEWVEVLTSFMEGIIDRVRNLPEKQWQEIFTKTKEALLTYQP